MKTQKSDQEDIIEALYPMRCTIDVHGSIHFASTAFRVLFKEALSIHEFLAPNSANELLSLLKENQNSQDPFADIDLFSIQIYTSWKCKVVALKNQELWMICFDKSQSIRKRSLATEIMSAEDIQEIRLQNFFYEALLHQLPAEVAVFDADFKFLFVNKNAIKNEELRRWLIGRSEIDYWRSKNLPTDKAEIRLQGFREAVMKRQQSAVEEVFHAGTEQEKHYIRMTHPYFIEDELQFLLTYGIDITALKHTENRLILQNTELEKVNAELDQFVYSASHNLRAPLLSIKGLLSLISPNDTPAEDRSRFMNEAYKSIERLDSTIHDIIEYSKNARLPIEPREINLSELIDQTNEDLRFFENVHLEVRKNLLMRKPFYSDLRRIKSILHNIISNAVKYSDKTKEQCFLDIDIRSEAEQCVLVFTDNGIGIQAEHADKVFDMFYRGTSTRTGSGLGLYIVKEMIEKLGGSIELKSTPGVGTEIRIELRNLAQSKENLSES